MLVAGKTTWVVSRVSRKLDNAEVTVPCRTSLFRAGRSAPCRMSLFCACSRRQTPSPRMAKKSFVSPLSQAEAGRDSPGTTPTPAVCRRWEHPPPCSLQGVTGVFPRLASLGSFSLADPQGTLLPAFVYGQHHLKKGVASTTTPQT